MDPGVIPVPPKAYSYVRFSTPEQAEGQSFDRQTTQAQEYAAKHGLELDTELTFQDLGVSAFTGQNAEKGALSAFRLAVLKGDIAAGSHLLIENFDRLSRMEPWDAFPIFQEIINHGITIVTLQDGNEWSREQIRENPMMLLQAIITMVRAHEESKIKGDRVRKAYDKKRANAAAGVKGKPFTRQLPAWLSWNERTERFNVNKERGKIVQAIYKMADEGRSHHTIAKALNERKVPTWGGMRRKAAFWHGSYVQKILRTSAVIGTFTPHTITKTPTGKLRTPQAPIENYFPPVVDKELFDRVAARLKTTAARGRNASAAPKSIFAGVISCAYCGGTVTRVAKGEHVYLVCAKAHAKAGCRYEATRYPNAEMRFRELADWIVDSAPRGKDTTELEDDIQQLNAGIDGLVTRAEEMADLAAQEKSEGARRRLREVEAQLVEADNRLRRLREDRDRLTKRAVVQRLEALRSALKHEPIDVAEVNKALRQAVSRIVLNPEQGSLTIYWQHAEEPSWPIVFGGRHMKWENLSSSD
jgi:DNA invertase Pin-like site-specific DNA recombinase